MTPCPKQTPSSAPSGVCQWYGEDHLCLRPEEFVCVEWRETGLSPRRGPSRSPLPAAPAVTSQPPQASGVVRHADASVTLTAWVVMAETEKALQVGRQGAFRSEALWVPKSQTRNRITLPSDDGRDILTITLSAWIAKEKHLS